MRVPIPVQPRVSLAFLVSHISRTSSCRYRTPSPFTAADTMFGFPFTAAGRRGRADRR